MRELICDAAKAVGHVFALIWRKVVEEYHQGDPARWTRTDERLMHAYAERRR